MLRFCPANPKNEYVVKKDRGYMVFDRDIWENCRKLLHTEYNVTGLPVVDNDGKRLCIAWQDDGANQELRMLDEIINGGENCIQFEEFYPDCGCVIIHGCNELSYRLAKYLESRRIPIVLDGRYWKYTDARGINPDETGFENEIEVFAEGTWEHSGEPWLEAARTVSVEFDCIYKLYMENVRTGRIPVTSRTPEQLFEYLKSKSVFLLGQEHETQDAYDALLSHGVDIEGFIDNKKDPQKLLGKEIFVWSELGGFPNPVLINCHDTCGVLGDGMLDFYVYNGYRRDIGYIYLKDYVDIPRTRLLNILRDKTVVLAGDELLCRRLRRYLLKNGVTEDNITSFGEYKGEAQNTVGLPVLPEIFYYSAFYYHGHNLYLICQKMKQNHIDSFSSYYGDFEAFVDMDIEQCQEKIFSSFLKPKGVILGCIPSQSGNVFLRSCIDNHPNILQLGYTPFESNIFWYCIRLVELEKDEIMPRFWEMVKSEFAYLDSFSSCFPDQSLFDSICRKLISKVDRTLLSQELFMVFCIANSAMWGRAVENINDYYIYWEPHNIPRYRIPLLLEWIAEANIPSFVIVGARNTVSQMGGSQRFYHTEDFHMHRYKSKSLSYYAFSSSNDIAEKISHKFKTIELRFEDVKLHPKEEWGKFCDFLGIPWSDTFLQTTRWGRTGKSGYTVGNVTTTGYDLKSVYNPYSEYLSPLDKLRIRICQADFLKEFRYSYESCLRFTRRELQELFLKDIKVEDDFLFRDATEVTEYYLGKADELRRRVRSIYNKAFYERDNAEEDCTVTDRRVAKLKKYGIMTRSTKNLIIKDLNEYIKKHIIVNVTSALESHDKVVLYGIGKNADWIVKNFGPGITDKLVYCDVKAQDHPITYHGKPVAAPKELLDKYKDYHIVVTPDTMWTTIKSSLILLGVNESRITCNTYPLYLEKEN